MRTTRDSGPAPGGSDRRPDDAEEKLRRSEARFRTVFDHAPMGIFLLGPDVRIVGANRAICTMLGYEEAELLGRVVTELVHPDDRAESERMRVRVEAGEVDAVAVERRGIRKDGRAIWLQVRSSVQREADGRIDLVITQLVDVTAQRLQEAQLRESEARFRTIFESAPIGMALIAPAGQLLQVNPALATMLGRSADALARLSVPEVIHPDDLESTRQQVEAALSGCCSDTIAGESRYLRADGAIVWGAYQSSLVRDADGVPRYFVSQVVDVTERKLAEDAVRESEARYRGLVELSQDLIVRMDLAGNLTFVNDAWTAKFGLRREEVMGRSVMPRILAGDRAMAAGTIRALAVPPHRARVEIRQPTVEGVRWLEWEGCGIFDDAGKVVELQAIGRDVTQEHEVAEALRASLAELRQSEEKLRRLAQRQVAVREEERKRLGFDLHDGVCQELIGIGILVESLRRRSGSTSSESAELARVSGYLGEVVEHLRVLAGELRPMLLHDLGLEDSLRSLAVGLSNAATTIVTVVPTPIPRLDEVAEVTVYRIAQEALTNALRHARAASIVVELCATEGRLRLEVRDDGCGFEPTRRRTTALGLLSMEERALALGGRLEVRSGPKNGTSIVLDCPLAERAGEPPAARR